MSLHSAEIAHLIGATIASITPFALSSMDTFQISFVFPAFLGPIPTRFLTIETFAVKSTVTIS